MRGQTKAVKSISLSGKAYLLHYHEEIKKPQTGDIYLYLNDETELYPILLGGYQVKGFKGYFKAKVYDGRAWCLLDSLDFFDDRLHQFSKTEICFYTFLLCQERLEKESGTLVYRSYREHYTTHLYEAGEYKGKRGLKSK